MPIGATEQHGPHLPLTTDTLLAEAFVHRVAQKSCGLVLPALPFGYSWTWRDIPGTLTLRFETFTELIRDVAESVTRYGVKALCIVTGHEANRSPLKYALREKIADQVPLKLLHLFYPGMHDILEEAESRAWQGELLHAEEVETSLMLAQHPELVRMGLAEADYPDIPELYGASVVTMGDIMRTGIFGDATVASAEKGRRWLELSTDRAAALWTGFLDTHGIAH